MVNGIPCRHDPRARRRRQRRGRRRFSRLAAAGWQRGAPVCGGDGGAGAWGDWDLGRCGCNVDCSSPWDVLNAAVLASIAGDCVRIVSLMRKKGRLSTANCRKPAAGGQAPMWRIEGGSGREAFGHGLTGSAKESSGLGGEILTGAAKGAAEVGGRAGSLAGRIIAGALP